jgi:hypothetical protein
MLGSRIATTAIQTEIPRLSRIIHHLRRRARSRICTIPVLPEAVKAGSSFKDLPPSGCSLCQQISDSTLPASCLPEIRGGILLPSNLNSPLSYTYWQSALSPLRCPDTEVRPRETHFPYFSQSSISGDSSVGTRLPATSSSMLWTLTRSPRWDYLSREHALRVRLDISTAGALGNSGAETPHTTGPSGHRAPRRWTRRKARSHVACYPIPARQIAEQHRISRNR